jgi:hypothetical protein
MPKDGGFDERCFERKFDVRAAQNAADEKPRSL